MKKPTSPVDTKATEPQVAETLPTPTPIERPYLIALRNVNGMLMHAGIRRNVDAAGAMCEYLREMPAPFNSYITLGASSTHDDNHWQFQVAFGPFLCTVTAEHLTAAQTNSAGDDDS